MMTLDEIRQILDLVREHQLAELELEQEGVKLRIRKDSAWSAGASLDSVPPAASRSGAPADVRPAAPAHDAPPAPDADEPGDLAIITSPIVGTFYRAADPGSPPFVDVGQRIEQGQVLCIIEAMKLMNEIASEYAGEVVKIYADNGQPVQYGERLFAIRAS